MNRQLQHHGAPHCLPAYAYRGGCPRRRATVYATLMTDAPGTPASVVTPATARPAVGNRPAHSSFGERHTQPSTDLQKQARKGAPVTVAMLEDVRTMFASLLKEYAYWVDDAWVSGTIPAELCGTYYRNGPALHVTNPRYRRHTLDGDGMIFSIAFRDGRAYFRNRFVRTKGFLAEQAAGRPLYRNSFTRGSHDHSTPWFNPFDLTFKNVANTGVLPWAGQLYALWEMDPTTLHTHRESRMGGQIRGNTFAAHYRIVKEQERQPEAEPPQAAVTTGASAHAAPGAGAPTAATAQQHAQCTQHAQHAQHAQWQQQQHAQATAHVGSGSSRRLVTFSNEYSYGGAAAVFYEFDEGGKLLLETKHSLPGIDIALIHDMLVTEHYYVLVMGSIRLDPIKFITQYAVGRCSIAEVMVFDPAQPTRIMMFPRPGRPSGKALAPRVLTTDPMFVFHNVNGWEVETAEGLPVVVLDCVAWDEVSFAMELFDKDSRRLEGFVGGARMQLTRLTCDLRTGAVQRRKLLQRTVEFPGTDPRVTSRPHSVAWFIADAVDHPVLWAPAQGIVRVEVDPALTLSPYHSRAAAATTAAGGGGGGRGQRLSPPRPAPCAVRGSAAAAAPGVAVDAWYFGERTFPGEPMFVPRPGSSREGDGWLIVATHNADTEKGDVHIFDAEDLSAGPVATLHLPHRLPLGLHGAWEGVYRGPDPEDMAVPRWQEVGAVRRL
ncbi:hypothetical protein PLESTM_001563900 [Pleodorina starrii]|nr:hypothetical protein PLESTM_001563900 [Pleodorina starrii]